MFGSHLSIAGGMVNALDEAERLGMDCVQVFTKNQRQWRVPALKDEDRDAWLTKLRSLKWHLKKAGDRTVSHNTYLINMASPDTALWTKSADLQRIELERCAELGINLCVAHPGAHLGAARKPGDLNDLEAAPTPDERAGLKRIIKALDRIHRDLPGVHVLTCLETTVGSGTNLGYRFEDLAFIRENVREPERVAYCLDTCHVTAAGYDMTTDAGAKAVRQRFEAVCGRRNLRVIHVNDSVGAIGSRKDRHAHIGDGTCGRACFRAIVNWPGLSRVPKILETPKGTDDRDRPWDSVNLRRLKRLISTPSASR